MNVLFSFDDGRYDAYEAYLILKKYRLVGSFHITTGFVDGSFNTDAFGVERKPVGIEQLVEMSNNGMDVSSHGDRHITDPDDFIVSINKLSKFGIKKEKYGFSVPNSDYSKEEIELFTNSNKNVLSYIRVGRSSKCYTFINKIHYVLYHLFHFQSSFNRFNKSNLLIDVNRYCINSLVVLSDTKAKNLINFIKKYKNTNSTLVLMFHSIVPLPKNKWEYSSADFEKICQFVSSNCKILTLEKLVS